MVEDIPESIYKLLLSTFSLNNTNRCDRVMQLVANYRKEKYTKKEIDKRIKAYVFGDITITAILDGENIIYKYKDNKLVTNHFDNIINIASKVNNLLKDV